MPVTKTSNRRTPRFPLAIALSAVLAALVLPAPALASSGFEADSYPVTLDGEALAPLTFKPGSEAAAEVCKTPDFTTTVNEPFDAFSTSPGEAGCGGGNLAMNGCYLTFKPSFETAGGELKEEEFDGSAKIGPGPPRCESITLTAGKCSASIPPQTGLAATFYNEEAEGVEVVRVKLEASGVKYACGETEHEDGELAGEWTVAGKDAGTYPATLKGTGLLEIAGPGGAGGIFRCAAAILEDTVGEPTGHLDLDGASLGECKAFDLTEETEVDATVLMNGCHFTLDVKHPGSSYEGEWDVDCKNPGEAIEFRLTKYEIECLNLLPQPEKLEGVELENDASEGSERGIEVDAQLSGVKYELVPSAANCIEGEAKTFSDGTLTDERTLTGEDEAKEQIGVYLSGEEPARIETEKGANDLAVRGGFVPEDRSAALDSVWRRIGVYQNPNLSFLGEQIGVYLSGEGSEQPTIAAESYPTVLGGQGVVSFSVPGSELRCEQATLESPFLQEAASQPPLAVSGFFSTHFGCRNVGSPDDQATMEMNSCKYVLEIDNPGGPSSYGAHLAVACEEGGDAIEVTVPEGGSSCTYALGPQQEHGGLELSNLTYEGEKEVVLGGEAGGVEYTQSGSSCAEAESNNASIGLQATLAGGADREDGAVDADVGVIDVGIDNNVDLDLVEHTGCAHPDLSFPEDEYEYTPPDFNGPYWHEDEWLNENEPFPENTEFEAGTYEYGCQDGTGYDTTPSNGSGSHGNGMAQTIGALDNHLGRLGIAAGARVFGLGIYPRHDGSGPGAGWGDEALRDSSYISALDWIAERKSEFNDGAADGDPGAPIGVVNQVVGCKVKSAGLPWFPAPECQREEAQLKALERVTKQGVVLVSAGSNFNNPVEPGIPTGYPDVITTTAVADLDGKPGGEAESTTCNGHWIIDAENLENVDDRRAYWSGYGVSADLAVPVHNAGSCAADGTSGATARASAAATLLTSQCTPTDRAGALAIKNVLTAEGTYDWEDTATETIPDPETEEENKIAVGWKEEPTDSYKEPLLNVSDPTVFDPKLVGEEGEDCGWLDKPAPDDVDGDRRSDLLTLDAAGGVHVHRGMIDGSSRYEPGGYGLDAQSTPSNPLEGTSPALLDPARLDAEGDYAIDTADVNGDGHDDLLTITEEGVAHVYLGRSDRSFAEEGIEAFQTSGTGVVMAGKGGEHEPIALADVNGDGRADYVYESHKLDRIFTAPGEPDGTFGEPVASPETYDSAFLDREGNYYLDVVNVDGKGGADLVSINTDGKVYVSLGQENGKFEAPEPAASINPIMDDGEGAEPVGLGDVNDDGRADLLVLSGETLKLYEGEEDGSFGEPSEPYAGQIDSNLTDGEGSELIGLLDYSRDGAADLVALDEAGNVLTYEADGETATFAEPDEHGGEIVSTRESAGGQRLLSEKPYVRTLGCAPDGCTAPTHPAYVGAETYPATLEGTGLLEIAGPGGAGGIFRCAAAKLEDTVGEPTGHLDLDGASFDECKAFDLSEETEVDATVSMNGCHFTLDVKNPASPYEGLWGVACKNPGEAIEFRLTKYEIKCLNLLPQQRVEGVELENDANEGSERGIEVGAQLSGVKYELVPSFANCTEGGEPETFSDGALTDERTLSGEDEAKEGIGVYLSGGGGPGVHLAGEVSEEESKQPRLEADSYPIDLESLSGLSELTTNKATISCESSSLEGTLAEAASSLDLDAAFGGCNLLSSYYGNKLATVLMNGCHFTLAVQNSEPLYHGKWDLVCPEGEAIEVRVTAFNLKCLKIHPQPEALESVALANDKAKQGVDFNAELTSVEYEWNGSALLGSLCLNEGKPETREDGVLSGAGTLAGAE